jgi:hypothetical protein
MGISSELMVSVRSKGMVTAPHKDLCVEISSQAGWETYQPESMMQKKTGTSLLVPVFWRTR